MNLFLIARRQYTLLFFFAFFFILLFFGLILVRSIQSAKVKTDSLTDSEIQELFLHEFSKTPTEVLKSRFPTLFTHIHGLFLEPESQIISTSEAQSLVSSSSILADYGFRYPVDLEGRDDCILRLGNCTGVGCEGAIWEVQTICADGWIKTYAAKFKKHKDYLVNYTVEGEELYAPRMRHIFGELVSLQENFASFAGYTVIPRGELGKNPGTCRLLDSAETPKRCNRLFTQMFPDDKKNELLVGHLMTTFVERLCIARKLPNVRENALPMIRDLAKAFKKLYEKRIIHCDFNHDHVGVAPKLDGMGFTFKIFDLGRLKFCKEGRCEPNLKAQMLQFASLVLDFCNDHRKCMPVNDAHYMWHASVCTGKRWNHNLEKMHELVMENAWEDIKERLANPFRCAHADLLRKVILEAYAPVVNFTDVRWDYIIELLDSKLQRLPPPKRRKKSS